MYHGLAHLPVHNKNLQPNVYEGGFDIWESTLDLLNLIDQWETAPKRVLDLGCGSGLVGIKAHLKFNCQVDFLDFNQSVIDEYTIPTCKLNKCDMEKLRFFHGDWSEFTRGPYDLILTSETLYDNRLYPSLFKCLQRNLEGECFLASKKVFIGLSGNVKEFMQLSGSRIVSEYNKGIKRVILKYEQEKIMISL